MFYMLSREVHKCPDERVLESARQWLRWTRIPSADGTPMTPRAGATEARATEGGGQAAHRKLVQAVPEACKRMLESPLTATDCVWYVGATEAGATEG